MITWPKGSIGTRESIAELNVVISGMSTFQNRWWKAQTSKYCGILPSRQIRNYRTINQTLWLSRRPAGHIIDVACPGDCRIRLKEEEKVNKYHDLAFEVKTLWKLKKVTITPIVIGALGPYTHRLEKYLEDIHVGLQTHTMQKIALLGSARILRQVLDC